MQCHKCHECIHGYIVSHSGEHWHQGCLIRHLDDEIQRLRENEMFLRDCLADRGMSATKELSN